MTFGIILGIVSITLTILFLSIGIIIRLYSYNKLWFKIIKTIIGVFLFIWFIIFRYIPDIKTLLDINSQQYIDEIQRSTYYSKVLLLDMCPFMYVALSVVLIFDWNSKITSYVALWSIIGSYITIIGSIWTTELSYNQSWYEYVFIKSSEGNLYYFIHIIMMTFGTMMFVYCDKYNLKSVISAYYLVISYMIYIVIVSKTLNVTNNVTGTVSYDWIYGEYSAIHKFLKFSNDNWWATMLVSYFLVWVFMNILMLLRFFISIPSEKFFFFKKMYDNEKILKFSNNWYLKAINRYNKIFKKKIII